MYGEKVYKIPVNVPGSCPNRDGVKGTGGCIFCPEIATGFETLSNQLSVRQQIDKNIAYIGPRYGANKFIAYFQNFSNTYVDLPIFKQRMEEAAKTDNVVGIAIATRPDCIDKTYLNCLQQIKQQFGCDIYMEYGLQSVNNDTLIKINRGHDVESFDKAITLTQAYKFNTCAHMILNLPWDSMEDVIEGARHLSEMGVDQVKLHALYIAENTKMGEMYRNGEIKICSLEEYVQRVVAFVHNLDSNIVIQRLIGRAPKEDMLFVNWNTSWWKIRDMIEEQR